MRPYKQGGFDSKSTSHGLFHVDVKDYSLIPKEEDDMFYAIYRRANTLLQAGRTWMGRSRYPSAGNAFQKAINSLKNCRMSSFEQECQQTDLLIALLENLMVCFNKMRRSRCVCNAMKDLRLLTRNNPSWWALCQEGRALEALGKYHRARVSYIRALKKRPGEQRIKEEITRISKRIGDLEETKQMLSQLSI
ncbi:inactive peptidyl-prolyl cis-trans isomerase shutdown [Drosophila teissieri]|uniref:inactive peptidyl-prolyl cis-trans isomerase shutdown n=1 Tax=Drosophila teissieri TaxID=7243 RepID=UPI001CB9F281|nr:inactive peptidyl-prolyl cis-trans isomerase shutdown [Drosophila teissieri]XP_043644737.1 inactive peptidyl-prolyl cis-trans isomerase shutdown [Drosophila teissieri]